MFLIELQVLCLVKNTNTDAGWGNEAGCQRAARNSLLSLLGQGQARGRTALALAFALFQMGGPPRPPLDMTTATSWPPQPHPSMGEQWASSFLSGSVYFQRSFSLHGEEHPSDFLESLNYRVL